jgi:choline dehydrogenase-like flavoprotein
MPKGAQRRVAVVGGGLAGLEAAVAATEQGAIVEVFEAGPQTRTRHVDWDATSHVGDEKVQLWTNDGWGAGGGLTMRLGGRSLCYHGVLLELEPATLEAWSARWADRFLGAGGLYGSILNSLRADYPELEAREQRPQLAALGLRHVPQAARFDEHGRFEAYTPLARALSLVADGRIRLTRGRVKTVRPKAGDCVVEVQREAQTERRGGFDACVLAASAIGNVEILAGSLGRSITTAVTDHLCVGVFVRLPPGLPLAPFRHRMLWSGFAAVPEFGMNLFLLERPALPCGDRIVQLQGVLEQQGVPSSYSELAVRLLPEGVQSHIRGNVPPMDRTRVVAAGGVIRRWAELLAAGRIVEVAPNDSPTPSASREKRDSKDRWLGHDQALKAVRSASGARVFSQYQIPYGAFEHEACTHPIGNRGPIPVSSDLEVIELPGVYVAGPGAFPRLGIANPALTIIAMSRWLGDRLAA